MKKLSRRYFVAQGLAGFAGLVACSEADSSKGSGGGQSGSGGAGGHAGSGSAGGSGGAAGSGTGGTGGFAQGPELESLIGDIGPLGDADANGVRLPAGFTSRIVARSLKPPVASSDYVWHPAPDGGATYLLEDGGWIYVSNSEIPFNGGVSALRFDIQGNVVDAYRILEQSSVNCAGGPTPWGTWLSCEEIAKGAVWECYPRGDKPAEKRPALGVFKHEAVAVEPVNQHLYLTEDESDGRLYRYVPNSLTESGRADLSAGKLQVAKVDAQNQVTWLDVPDPEFSSATPTRSQVPDSTAFRGGEGIYHHNGVIYFSTKGDNRIWAYDVKSESIKVLYDAATHQTPILTGVDNVIVSASGDVLVAEDGGDMEVCAILPDGSIKALLQVEGHLESEITGLAFDPSGTRLYFSSQRGPSKNSDDGYTFEVSGPFHRAKT
ncbi:MAG: DUF839 domain-containing protein [Polyangiaceae bacterium]|nr:DUF839 domain-containing protein [Polyangiaceae bacterium]MCB9608095.1 DUF839 domain-containing protein [Polyangiaceae bacterium]